MKYILPGNKMCYKAAVKKNVLIFQELTLQNKKKITKIDSSKNEDVNEICIQIKW